MRLIFLSGLSGSGKSVALHMLEDLDFYCIDNIPAALLKPFISHTVRSSSSVYQRTAIGIDARNPGAEIATVPMLLDELKRSGIQCELVFLVASDEELLRRFAETRRKHPLSRQGENLHEAIAIERGLLEPLVNAADLVVDTSRMGVHELRELINRRVGKRPRDRMSVLFESFGFKHGIPGDADFVFDARSLPNPYWEPTLAAAHRPRRAGGALSRGAAGGRALHRRCRALHRGAHTRASGRQPPLPDGRDRLHRRPAPLGLHRRAARGAHRRPLAAGRGAPLGACRKPCQEHARAQRPPIAAR